MDIITQKGENVNVFTGNIPTSITEIMLQDSQRWTMHKNDAKKMAERLLKIHQYARGYRMQQCAQSIHMSVCASCGHKHVYNARLCRDRFCPICSWRLSMRRFANMMQIVQGLRERYPEAEWQFVTLTLENCQPRALRDTIDEMARAWNCIWSRKTTKKMPILGWARSLEITYNAKSRTFHPHYHVLVLWADAYSPSEHEQKWLERAWMDTIKIRTHHDAQDSTMVRSKGRQMVPSIYDQTEDDAQTVLTAVLETYKYSIKSKEMQEMPLGVFQLLDELLKGRRMVAFGGAVKDFAKEIGLTSMEAVSADDESDDPGIKQCASCKSVKLIQVVGQWTGDGYLWRRDM